MNESRLIADMEVICWKGQHLGWTIGLSIPMILIYVIGIPALGLGLLTRHRKHLGD